MRSVLFVTLSFWCCIAMAQTNEPPPQASANAMRELRIRTLTTAPGDLGIHPSKAFPRVYGVLMDWAMDGITVSIVSLADGNASLYTTTTFGVIGGIEHAAVRAAAVQFVRTAEGHYDAATPVKEYPYPKPGHVRFYLIAFDGVRMIETAEEVFKSDQAVFSGLGLGGQRVMTELRLIAQPKMEKQR